MINNITKTVDFTINLYQIVESVSDSELLELKNIVDYQLRKRGETAFLIWELDLSARSRNVLISCNITTLKQLASFTTKKFLSLKNVGESTLCEMTNLLLKNGLNWRD